MEGVLDGSGKLRPRISAVEARRAIQDGSVKGGMIPKLEHCVSAVRNGVTSAHVIDGRVSHALLLEIFTDEGVGTIVQ